MSGWWVLIIIILLVGLGVAISMYVTGEQVLDQFFSEELEKVAEKYRLMCEQEKGSEEAAAIKLLNEEIAKRDLILAEEKAKCEAAVNTKTMTFEESTAKLQALLDTANEEIDLIKAELELEKSKIV